MRRGQAGGVKGMLAMLTVALVAAAAVAPLVGAQSGGGGGQRDDKLLFFAADGLRQDAVAQYADQGATPGFRALLRRGARASGSGLLTQAPPNTGAGWFTLATGAWPGVAGSTNNTFHVNGQPFGNRTAAFDPGVLQAETLAQAAERGGKKVAQIEWAGGRSGTIAGPTLDYRNFRSGRGVATNYISPNDSASFTASFGLQFDHPAGFAGQAPFAQAAPSSGERLVRRAGVLQPGAGDAPARARRHDRQVRAQRLHLRQPQRRPHRLRPRPLLADEGRRRRRRESHRRRVGRRQGHDPGQQPRREDRRHAGQGRAARR